MAIPQIGSGNENVYSYRQPGLTYGYNEENIAGKVDGQDAVKQAIHKMLLTERYGDAIYDEDYGVELEQYIGKGYGYLVAGIEDTLKDALLQDDRITDINVTEVKDLGNGEASITFTASTIYGDIEDNLGVRV